jgi:hypothetical protein
MKTFFMCQFIAVLLIATTLGVGHAQETEATKEIGMAIRDYLMAMSTRDIQGVRAVLAAQFTAVEAADSTARIHLVDTASGKGLLPPEGNRDWDKDKIKLSSVKAEVSATHPSVAIASFTLSALLSDKQVAALEAALKLPPEEFDESRRKTASKLIGDRAVHSAMFAMLAKAEGKWRIVCMSFPK